MFIHQTGSKNNITVNKLQFTSYHGSCAGSGCDRIMYAGNVETSARHLSTYLFSCGISGMCWFWVSLCSLAYNVRQIGQCVTTGIGKPMSCV